MDVRCLEASVGSKCFAWQPVRMRAAQRRSWCVLSLGRRFAGGGPRLRSACSRRCFSDSIACGSFGVGGEHRVQLSLLRVRRVRLSHSENVSLDVAQSGISGVSW